MTANVSSISSIETLSIDCRSRQHDGCLYYEPESAYGEFSLIKEALEDFINARLASRSSLSTWSSQKALNLLILADCPKENREWLQERVGELRVVSGYAWDSVEDDMHVDS